MTDRLTKSDWIVHGLRTLASEGAAALKVGPMSAKLEVSRGSFYWHFRDIGDFRSQILQGWQERTTDQVIEDIEAEERPDRLKRLLRRAFGAERGRERTERSDDWLAERAIRSWAAEDADVAAIVASVDASRVGYIEQLLIGSGVEANRATPRATFLYWAYLGRSFVMNPRHSSIAAPALDSIGDLFSG